MNVGIVGKQEIIVTPDVTASAIGSGLLDVYGTPSMIALMEKTASESIASELEPGQGTVGIKISVEHLSATPLGMKVVCETKLVEVDRKRLVFEVSAYDEAGLIGKGVHERFIIDNEKFMAKALTKNAQ